MFFDRLRGFFAPKEGSEPSVAAPSVRAGSAPSEDRPRGEPLIAFVLFGGLRPAASEIASELAGVTRAAQPPTDLKVADGVVTFSLGDEIGAVALMGSPFPARDLEGALAATWLLPPKVDRSRITGHGSQAIITLVGGKGAPIDRLLALTQLTRVLAARGDAVAVIWGPANLLHHPPMFVQMAQKLASAEAPPLFLWVNLRVGRNPNGTNHFGTQGLPALGHMEIELPSTRLPAGELREWIPNIIMYLLEKGPVLKHGQTIGPDARTQYKISHQPSSFGREGTVISLSE